MSFKNSKIDKKQVEKEPTFVVTILRSTLHHGTVLKEYHFNRRYLDAALPLLLDLRTPFSVNYE